MSNKHVIEATADNFENEVMQSTVPVLVDFWATWCGPCRMIAPILDEIAAGYDGRAKVVKINVDEQPTLAANFNVMSIPTLIFIKNGQVVQKEVGARTKEALSAALDKLL